MTTRGAGESDGGPLAPWIFGRESAKSQNQVKVEVAYTVPAFSLSRQTTGEIGVANLVLDNAWECQGKIKRSGITWKTWKNFCLSAKNNI